MKPAPLILALDLATVSGWARGPANAEAPECGIVRFGAPDASAGAIFGAALAWFSDFLKPEPRPDIIVLEAMLPPQALKGETSRATRDRLAGLHGIIRAVANCRGIFDVSEVSVLTVRKHFCGKSNAGKEGVWRVCRSLGWPVNDLNASDAAAIWSFACGLVRPQSALRVTPLFGKRPMRISA